MFNVGTAELMVILLIALVVLGPDKLPEAARKMGSMMKELRGLTSGFKQEVKTALHETGIDPEVSAVFGDSAREAQARKRGDALVKNSRAGSVASTPTGAKQLSGRMESPSLSGSSSHSGNAERAKRRAEEARAQATKRRQASNREAILQAKEAAREKATTSEQSAPAFDGGEAVNSVVDSVPSVANVATPATSE